MQELFCFAVFLLSFSWAHTCPLIRTWLKCLVRGSSAGLGIMMLQFSVQQCFSTAINTFCGTGTSSAFVCNLKCAMDESSITACSQFCAYPESFLCSMVKWGGILAFHQYADLAFFFLILCVVKVWHQGLFPAITFGLFSITTRKKMLLCCCLSYVKHRKNLRKRTQNNFPIPWIPAV